MRINRFAKIAVAFAFLATAFNGRSAAQEPLSVVTSFSILDDFVSQIGGPLVDVHTIVPPNADVHAFEPTPADARAIAAADLVVINGLNFESGIERLIEASGYEGPVIVATAGIVPLLAEEHDEHENEGEEHEEHAGDDHGEEHDDHAHDGGEDDHNHGPNDPHAWQDVGNARVYARNIADALVTADPENAATYESNWADFDAELAALDSEIRMAIGVLPDDRRTIVTSHDAFGYFANAYGLEFLAPVGVATDADPSAAQIAELVEQIRSEGIDALILEAAVDPRTLEQIARETGTTIGGELYSDTLSEAGGVAPTYLAMMRHNLEVITASLRQ